MSPSSKPSAFDSVDAPSTDEIARCVHCGFCLQSCPTYQLWGEEMDSPRGRIYLMKATSEGRMAMSDVFIRHMDACLGCMACETACPSGVHYGALIERTRAQIERHHTRGGFDRLLRGALFTVLPYPRRLQVLFLPLLVVGSALRMLAASRAFSYLPAVVQSVVSLAPAVTWSGLTATLPERTQGSGPHRQTVGLLAGCVQRVAFAHVNKATIRVLSAEGCEVVVPANQPCCGALALHAGQLEAARVFARQVIAAFDDRQLERIVVNAAGCGSAMKEYAELLADDPDWADRAKVFSAKVRDVSEVLMQLGESQAPRHPITARVAYHDACHLSHAQGVRAAPRSVLSSIPGLTVVTPAESEVCCGSAGIYNLVQPTAASELGKRKVANIAAVAPDVVATGNPGCLLQIGAGARAAGASWRIVHPIEIVDASIRGVPLE